MSTSRIPLEQVFRSKTRRVSTDRKSATDGSSSIADSASVRSNRSSVTSFSIGSPEIPKAPVVFQAPLLEAPVFQTSLQQQVTEPAAVPKASTSNSIFSIFSRKEAVPAPKKTAPASPPLEPVSNPIPVQTPPQTDQLASISRRPRLPSARLALTTTPLSLSSITTANMSSPSQVRGNRTAQMIEFERQAEERAKEIEQMNDERDRMLEEESRIQREMERIAQEEYEMRQYYEAEALKHAEEKRVHMEEVRRHQERLREHERRIRDHEVNSEAFAKVIAMPARAARVSFMANAAKLNGVNGA